MKAIGRHQEIPDDIYARARHVAHEMMEEHGHLCANTFGIRTSHLHKGTHRRIQWHRTMSILIRLAKEEGWYTMRPRVHKKNNKMYVFPTREDAEEMFPT